MKKWMLLLFVALSVLVTACGNSKTAPAAADGAASSPPDASAQTTLDQIKKRGKLIIGTSGNYRPLTYMDEQGKLTGFDIDWGNALAKELGVTAEFVPGNVSGLLAGLNAGKFDIVMSGLLMTEERKKAIDFSSVYYKDGVVALAKKDNKAVTGITHLQGLTVGVIGGAAQHSDLLEIGGYKELKEYPGNAEGFADLKNGRIQLYALGKIAANDFIKNDKDGSQYAAVGDMYKLRDAGIGIRKNDSALKKAIDDIIEKKQKDGSYNELAVKWFGFAVPN
ncbi:ABC transporter substrate-binding protein [Paenibacillus sp. CC-CFT747]|nr:ABC transporter substrate-binding protein [Paenibacillus sp. CC-CFT747]